MTPTDRPTRVLYLHGLESGPNAGKVIALRQGGFEVFAPQLDSSAATALVYAGSRDRAEYHRALETPLAQAVEALGSSQPEVIVGSSFGAAVLLRLLHDHGPPGGVAVMLAGAGVKMTTHSTLPEGARVVLIHGRGDAVIPLEDSRTLAASSARAMLIEVYDDHPLHETGRSGLLCDLVRLAARFGG